MKKTEKQRAQERVAICKDALAWIKAGALIPTMGVYVSPTITPREFSPNNGKTQLRDIKLGKCQVCAKGALFLAKAVRYNNVLAAQWDNACDDSLPGGVMGEHFSFNQLWVIEDYFEGRHFGNNKNIIKWVKKYPNAKDRLIAILNNIIENKGTFKP
jgi:hypothetical protein